jgi:PUA domain protein
VEKEGFKGVYGGLKRHFVKVKDLKRLVGGLPKPLQDRLVERLPRKFGVEVCRVEDGFRIYLVDGKPFLLVDRDGRVMPPLTAFETLTLLPWIVVDRGAIPHICNGADVMRPGIVQVERDFDKNSLVVVVDVDHRKPLALGIALLSSQEVRRSERGKMVKTIHHVGDKIWNFYRNF